MKNQFRNLVVEQTKNCLDLKKRQTVDWLFPIPSSFEGRTFFLLSFFQLSPCGFIHSPVIHLASACVTWDDKGVQRNAFMHVLASICSRMGEEREEILFVMQSEKWEKRMRGSSGFRRRRSACCGHSVYRVYGGKKWRQVLQLFVSRLLLLLRMLNVGC